MAMACSTTTKNRRAPTRSIRRATESGKLGNVRPFQVGQCSPFSSWAMFALFKLGNVRLFQVGQCSPFSSVRGARPNERICGRRMIERAIFRNRATTNRSTEFRVAPNGVAPAVIAGRSWRFLESNALAASAMAGHDLARDESLNEAQSRDID